jgi:hypothetical protein
VYYIYGALYIPVISGDIKHQGRNIGIYCIRGVYLIVGRRSKMKLFLILIFSLMTLIPCVASCNDVDYEAMRLQFASREDFKPYAIAAFEKALIDEAMKAWKTGDIVKATEMLNKVLAAYPVSIMAHRVFADMAQRLIEKTEDPQYKKGLRDLEKKHRTLCEGLLKSILSSGDGKTAKTAYKVITIPEEYMVLWYLGLQFEVVALEHDGTKSFDVITAKNRAGGKEKLYFDVTILMNSQKKSGFQEGVPPARQETAPTSR